MAVVCIRINIYLNIFIHVSATIVTMAFDDSLHDLTDYERDQGLAISDVFKVVRLPPLLPPMREVWIYISRFISIVYMCFFIFDYYIYMYIYSYIYIYIYICILIYIYIYKYIYIYI
jgi:hypothetical protein